MGTVSLFPQCSSFHETTTFSTDALPKTVALFTDLQTSFILFLRRPNLYIHTIQIPLQALISLCLIHIPQQTADAGFSIFLHLYF